MNIFHAAVSVLFVYLVNPEAILFVLEIRFS
jgi:hypothetical protein